jgi:hypothetical protein
LPVTKKKEISDLIILCCWLTFGLIIVSKESIWTVCRVRYEICAQNFDAGRTSLQNLLYERHFITRIDKMQFVAAIRIASDFECFADIGCPTSGVAQRAMREAAPHARGVSKARQL